MPSKNHGRMAQDMKRELIAIIGEMKDPRVSGGLLTVTRLDVTPDLDVAKVYISVMGREGGAGGKSHEQSFGPYPHRSQPPYAHPQSPALCVYQG